MVTHIFSDCPAKTCSQCNTPFNNHPFCIKFKTHPQPNTRWIHPKYTNFSSKNETGKNIGANTVCNPSNDPDSHALTIKEARKALNAAIKAGKKHKLN